MPDLTPEQFLAFVDELAKRGTLTQVNVGYYNVTFTGPNHNAELAATIKEVATMLVRANGKHLSSV